MVGSDCGESRGPRGRRSTRVAVAAAAACLAASLISASPALAATPGLSGQASPSDFPIGVAIYDVATLSGGATPSGTIAFDLYARATRSAGGR